MKRLVWIAAVVLATLRADADLVDDWSNYVAAVAERADAVGQARPLPVQTFVFDLGVTNTGSGCETNVFGPFTNIVCWTNWALASTSVVATNFVAVWNGQTQRVEFVSAAAIAEADETIRAMLSAGQFVDAAAIGTVTSWIASKVATNWYFVPEGDRPLVSNAQWFALAECPTSFPVLTISQAWARAGMPVITNWTVATNAVATNVFGWSVGVLTQELVTVTNSGVRTNLTRSFKFGWEPARTNFACTLASVIAKGVVDETNLLWQFVRPESLPADVVPGGDVLAAASCCTLIWLPPWTSAPLEVVSASIDIVVTGQVFSVGTGGWSRSTWTSELVTIPDLTVPATVAMARTWSFVQSVQAPSNGLATNLPGASIHVAFSSATARVIGDQIATHGLGTNLLTDRAALLGQMRWTVADAIPAGVAGYADVNIAFTNAPSFLTPPIAPVGNVTNAMSDVLFRIERSGLAQIGELESWTDVVAQVGFFNHYEIYNLSWARTGGVATVLESSSTTLAFRATLFGQMLPANPFPHRRVGSDLLGYFPRTQAVVVTLFTNENFDSVQRTSSVVWTDDALGAWTNRLVQFPTISASSGSHAVTQSIFYAFSPDAGAGSNFQVVTQRFNWLSGEHVHQTLFASPTSRRFIGTWLIDWAFSRMTNAP